MSTAFTFRDTAFLAKINSGEDPDAAAYLNAVEVADGATLEAAVRVAINAFVVGCKTDGIWTAIKASCILAGARTLGGALVPLAGSAPTNFNFVSGDYNRRTGLKGNASNKYLNSNRNQNLDPLNSKHLSVYATELVTSGAFIIGASTNVSPFVASELYMTIEGFNGKIQSGTDAGFSVASTGLMGLSRDSSTNLNQISNGILTSRSNSSTNKNSLNSFVFARNLVGSASNFVNARLSFYSIGESLDLALLDSRVSALMTALDSAIP